MHSIHRQRQSLHTYQQSYSFQRLGFLKEQRVHPTALDRWLDHASAPFVDCNRKNGPCVEHGTRHPLDLEKGRIVEWMLFLQFIPEQLVQGRSDICLPRTDWN